MSKLRLNGTSSGYVEIAAAPDAANNTITLPSDTGSIIVQSTTGITSFANAPVVIGSGTSTGTASQTLQVTGGAYVSGSVAIGKTIPKTTLQVSDSSVSAPIPTLGIATASLYVTNLDSNYGLLVGSNSNGNSWMQVQRTDGTATAYDLLLQPSGGNLGVGTASPAAKLQSAGTSGSVQFRAGTATNGYVEINAFDSNPVYCVIGGSNATAGVFGTQSNIPTIFFSNNAERARITSAGLFQLATTSLSGGIFNISGYTDGGYTGVAMQPTANNSTPFSFRNAAGTQIGSISCTSSATAYNTSSDYRLKENIITFNDAIDKLQRLKPIRFNFISDPDKIVDGFLAHEAAEVVPECVTGEKDEVDANGNPIYQGIDQSKLVPLLTAALQEAIARIETLEAEVQTLKDASTT